MIALAFESLNSLLKLLAYREVNKDREELGRIRKEYYAEKSKDDPNMALLDNLEFELSVLCGSVNARASKVEGQTISIS